VIIDQQAQRFCRPCGRFHDVGAFHPDRCWCKKAAHAHNERRKRSRAKRAQQQSAFGVCEPGPATLAGAGCSAGQAGPGSALASGAHLLCQVPYIQMGGLLDDLLPLFDQPIVLLPQAAPELPLPPADPGVVQPLGASPHLTEAQAGNGRRGSSGTLPLAEILATDVSSASDAGLLAHAALSAELMSMHSACSATSQGPAELPCLDVLPTCGLPSQPQAPWAGASAPGSGSILRPLLHGQGTAHLQGEARAGGYLVPAPDWESAASGAPDFADLNSLDLMMYGIDQEPALDAPVEQQLSLHSGCCDAAAPAGAACDFASGPACLLCSAADASAAGNHLASCADAGLAAGCKQCSADKLGRDALAAISAARQLHVAALQALRASTTLSLQ
jgi:hypothetical protein